MTAVHAFELGFAGFPLAGSGFEYRIPYLCPQLLQAYQGRSLIKDDL